MYDVIKCKADPKKFGFENFYFSDKIKIREVGNLKDAVKYKNQKVLIKLRDHAFDEGVVKLIGEKNKACFLIDLGLVIKSKGVQRAIMISKLRTFLSLCIRHNCLYAFASFSEDEKQIRKPAELCHIAMLFGLNRGQAKQGLKIISQYA